MDSKYVLSPKTNKTTYQGWKPFNDTTLNIRHWTVSNLNRQLVSQTDIRNTQQNQLKPNFERCRCQAEECYTICLVDKNKYLTIRVRSDESNI